VLVLMVHGTNVSFKVRPQKLDHDLVIGRSDASVQPDIDLTDYGAAGMGVSRMHVSVHYEPKHASLSVTDMNTLNGTFINGVQLHPQEVRVLRHGDELRLGQLRLTVHFYFAEA
jgi:pSer/pThr/pTyr-binding forkhead associated (FHA) protein